MSYSIELYFDANFERKFYNLWNQLGESGVPSIHQNMGSRPHISLSVLELINEEQLLPLLKSYLYDFNTFNIEFSAIALIPGEQQTVYLMPQMNSQLLDMQYKLFQLLKNNNLTPREHYEPSKWLPHCTVSKELNAPAALKTVEICQNSSLTGEAKAVELGLVEFRPRKDIYRFSLNEK